MKNIFTIIFIFSSLYSQSECDGVRYTNEIFSAVNVTSNIQYGGATNQSLFCASFYDELYLDIYEPEGDAIDDRPLVFFLYGGSFIAGSKTDGNIVELCTRYAKMGYVASAINYRLSQCELNILFGVDAEDGYTAAAKAIFDLKAAIRWFRMNDELYNDYRIDTDRIYAGGFSAGAITAINAAYMDLDSEIPSFITDYVADNGGLEGESGNPGYDSHFHGVINLSGGLGETDWVEAGDVPIVSTHGNEDTVVPYGDCHEYFTSGTCNDRPGGLCTWIGGECIGRIELFGLNMEIYGSYAINQTMNELGNYSALHTFGGQDHNIYSGNTLDITIDFTRDFMVDVVCPPVIILGDINADGFWNVQDIILLVQCVLGQYCTELENAEAADLNGDGVYNIMDVVSLVNCILGGNCGD